MSPAEVLFDQLDYANRHPSVSGEALFFEFVTNSKIKSSDGVTVGVEFFMDRLIDMFKELPKKILDVELDYIEYVLEQVRVSKHMIPLLFGYSSRRINACFIRKYGECSMYTIYI